jgi:hypothetical protein
MPLEMTISLALGTQLFVTVDHADIVSPVLLLMSLSDASACGHIMWTQHVVGHLSMHNLHVLDVPLLDWTSFMYRMVCNHVMSIAICSHVDIVLSISVLPTKDCGYRHILMYLPPSLIWDSNRMQNMIFGLSSFHHIMST